MRADGGRGEGGGGEFLVMINKKKLDEEEKMEFIWEQCEKDPLVKKAISKAIKKQWIEGLCTFNHICTFIP